MLLCGVSYQLFVLTVLIMAYNKIFTFKYSISLLVIGDLGGTVVKVLCYKSEGRWFDPRCCHWNFSLI